MAGALCVDTTCDRTRDGPSLGMTDAALIMMLSTFAIAGGMCSYFFYRVLTAKPKHEPDSYTDDDER